MDEKKINSKDHDIKSRSKSLEVNLAISRKNSLVSTQFWNWQETEVN